MNNDLTVCRIHDILCRRAAGDTFLQALHHVVVAAVDEGADLHVRDLTAVSDRAVFFLNNDFLGYVDKSSGQITRVGGTQSGIGQTLAGAMRAHEIFQNVQTFTEVGLDGQLDGTAGGIGHHAAHAGKLFDLLIGTTGAGIRHDTDVIVFAKAFFQLRCQVIVSLIPDFNDFLVALFVRRQTEAVVHIDLVDRRLGFVQDLLLGSRHDHVGNGNRHGGSGRVLVADRFNPVKHLSGLGGAVDVDGLLQDLLQHLLVDQEIHFQRQLVAGDGAVHKAKVLIQNLIEEEAAERGVDIRADGVSVRILSFAADRYKRVKIQFTVLISQNGFVHVAVGRTLALRTRTDLCQIINTQNHILRRNGHGAAVGRLQ